MKINEKTLCIEFCPDDFVTGAIEIGTIKTNITELNIILREFMESMPIYYGRKMDDADQYILGAEEEKGDEIKTRLIGPVPIVRDSAESLLREIVEGDIGVGLKRELIDRAKALLERGEE